MPEILGQVFRKGIAVLPADVERFMGTPGETSGTNVSSATQSAPVAAQSPPDWSQIKHEVACPLCGYNLRGLIEPRCPECGYRFAWSEMLDPNAVAHPYLFEHHPERNLWSYYRTVRGACRPKEFWTTLHPRQPSRPGRLLLYWMLGAMTVPLLGIVPFLGCSLAVSSVQVGQRKWNANRLQSDPAWRRTIIAQFGSVDTYLRRTSPFPRLGRTTAMLGVDTTSLSRLFRSSYMSSIAAYPLILALLWPGLVLLALMIFQLSMRRAKVRTIHVLRSIVYSFDPLAWTLLTVIIWFVIAVVPLLSLFVEDFVERMPAFLHLREYGIRHIFNQTILITIFVALVLLSRRLVAAYRYYLRLDRPRATVLAAEVIAALALLTGIAVLSPRAIEGFFHAIGL